MRGHGSDDERSLTAARPSGRMAAVCALLCIAAWAAMIIDCTHRYIYIVNATLEDALETARSDLLATEGAVSKIADVESRRVSTIADICASVAGDSIGTYQTISELGRVLPHISLYFVDDDGTVLQSLSAEQIDDFTDIIRGCESGGTYRDRDMIFCARRMSGGVCIAAASALDSLFVDSMLMSSSEIVEHIYWDTATHEQIYSSSARAADAKYESFSSGGEPSSLLESLLAPLSFGYDDELGYITYIKRSLTDGTEVVAFTGVISAGMTILRSVLAELILVPIAISGMLIFAAGLPRGPGSRRIFGRYFLRTRSLSHISIFAVICVLVVVCVAGYLQVLSDQSAQNIFVKSSLDDLEERVAIGEANIERISSFIDTANQEVMDLISYALRTRPEAATDDLLARIARELGFIELTVFDGDGRVIISSAEMRGHTINTAPGQPDAGVADILSGRRTTAKGFYGSSKKIGYAASAIEGGGIVRIIYDLALKNEILDLCSFESALSSADFGTGIKIYCRASDPTVLYAMPPGAKGSEVWPNNAALEVPTALEMSFAVMDGRTYYVTSMPLGDKVVMIAETTHHMFAAVLSSILVAAAALAAAYAAIASAYAVSTEGTSEPEPEEPEDVDAIQLRSRKIIGKMVSWASIITLSILAVDSVCSSTSLFGYLMSNSWPAGVNLFSVTKIILVALLVWVVSFVVRKAVIIAVDNLAIRAVTVGHMLCSLIKFGELFFVISYALVQFGVELSSLLAGAGLAGAGLAIAGQSVVSDLLSGLFIVFEGKVGVGDWVTLGDWRGQIAEIGVRTTTIVIDGNMKIVNNSQLGGIVVLSTASSGAICTFQIAYEEDAERAIALLNSSSREYRRECADIIEGPIARGIVELGDSGVTLKLWARIRDQRTASRTSYAMLRVTKRILDRSGISIPFPQVVVHRADETEGAEGSSTNSKQI